MPLLCRVVTDAVVVCVAACAASARIKRDIRPCVYCGSGILLWWAIRHHSSVWRIAVVAFRVVPSEGQLACHGKKPLSAAFTLLLPSRMLDSLHPLTRALGVVCRGETFLRVRWSRIYGLGYGCGLPPNSSSYVAAVPS